jgi:hypothetical protein
MKPVSFQVKEENTAPWPSFPSAKKLNKMPSSKKLKGCVNWGYYAIGHLAKLGNSTTRKECAAFIWKKVTVQELKKGVANSTKMDYIRR